MESLFTRVTSTSEFKESIHGSGATSREWTGKPSEWLPNDHHGNKLANVHRVGSFAVPVLSAVMVPDPISAKKGRSKRKKVKERTNEKVYSHGVSVVQLKRKGESACDGCLMTGVLAIHWAPPCSLTSAKP